ncbi:SOS response-associated peptidase [Pedobacter sp. CFBP9032]|uniref:SOS response-associated peptidase n=1 Tax=Pedobacter sp. CFBP9032 TaxID=3096539 RepID=UPI002A6AAB31|nr:SOS response-associated peptidase [Pedobacter sp. CFBP9032]MDY0905614.1 SOS response-associated peptidase [Pedobacter sp. CFBP9032]
MCYRTTQLTLIKKLGDYYKAPVVKPEDIENQKILYQANGFSHPQLATLVNSDGRQMRLLQWGLMPNWSGKSLSDMLKHSNNTLNAKVETARTLPSFRDAIKNKRCIIPVESFFEYKHIVHGQTKEKEPYLIHPKQQPYFNLGGLYSHYKNPENGEWISTFTILTQPANEYMATIHNSAKRMPMMLNDDLIDDWINPDSPTSLVDEIMKYSCDDSSLSAFRVSTDLIKMGNSPDVLKSID